MRALAALTASIVVRTRGDAVEVGRPAATTSTAAMIGESIQLSMVLLHSGRYGSIRCRCLVDG
uniref:Uncharacterized protein n=1 Tax=Verrucosispora sp. MS100047 TaxID=1410949 RepID=A0A097CT93_9ACTN|nr:hypothetical protein VASRM7_634 [Verrucosispora sp. MS100047]